MIFLFPSDYFNPKQVDEMYADQVSALNNVGLNTAVISLESLGSKLPKINPPISQNSHVVYRGWMLSPLDYELLVNAVDSTGSSAFTSKAEYLLTHYLPNWYPLIADLTPATKFYTVDDHLETELKILGWERFFIKDYVKSLKTSSGSILEQPSEIRTVVTQMQKFRGTIEGGICVRQVEDFVVESERRYFVVSGQPFSASLDEEIPYIVKECAVRIPSKFFCVDVVDRQDGVKRIVEIGDGQVSDIVGWSAERFAQIWGGNS
ncbi:MAG: ATP-grasp domain-containing protein [Microcoleus sp. PH2017_40_RAT_O_B]|uniref:ATP-grasp domain-containing protein n=1 Tax=unclassified Microcoleus TaxID=2642155 RepID=UPI001DDEF253|nr:MULTISPECIES: ATP-grasp domain-containing protein [unclassified Microcoleus]MCC3573733.1 ATP-grasp domain-containing protein [Microcoleus sp. PH2017_34_RAT_O_A]MCC3611179.1 ATP-grasp domain-containing protein [Microcoleus sp. PH2017_40_RAT_O_B]